MLKTPAITLKSRKWGEADRIVTFYTVRFGKLRGVARGARRMKSRFGSSLEPFVHCDLNLFEKHNDPLYRITQADIRNLPAASGRPRRDVRGRPHGQPGCCGDRGRRPGSPDLPDPPGRPAVASRRRGSRADRAAVPAQAARADRLSTPDRPLRSLWRHVS